MNPLIAALLAAGVISAEEARTLNGLLNEGATRIEAEQRVAAAFATGFENQRSRLIRALDMGNVDYRDPMLPTFWAAEHDILARDVLPTLTGIAQDVALTATVRSGGLADWRTVNEAVIAWTDSHYRSVAGDALGSIPNLDNTARDAVADAVVRWQRGELNAGPGPMGLPRLIAELQNVDAFGVDRAARIAVTETTRIFSESERTAAQANPNMEYLVWQTASDEVVCLICAPLDGQRIPKGQATFPGGYYPPAHPNCRCGVTAVTEFAAEVLSGAAGGPAAIAPGASPLHISPAMRDELLQRIQDKSATVGEPVRQKVLATEKTIEVRLEKLQEERFAIMEKYFDEKNALMQQYGPLSPEVAKFRAAHDKALAKNMAKMDKVRADVMDKALGLPVKQRNPLTVKSDPHWIHEKAVPMTGKAGDMLPAHSQAAQFVSSISRQQSINPIDVLIHYMKGGRANASPHGSIEIKNYDNGTTMAHELGHMLEFAAPARAQQAVRLYLEQRNSTTPLEKLKDITGHSAYSDDEVAHRDKWLSPYTGKVYSTLGTSEVISMGVQYLHEDPVSFAKNDPDHFNFVIAFLRGGL